MTVVNVGFSPEAEVVVVTLKSEAPVGATPGVTTGITTGDRNELI